MWAHADGRGSDMGVREIRPDNVLERHRRARLQEAQGGNKWLRVCGSRGGEALASLHM